jgi:hypothetical protein
MASERLPRNAPTLLKHLLSTIPHGGTCPHINPYDNIRGLHKSMQSLSFARTFLIKMPHKRKNVVFQLLKATSIHLTQICIFYVVWYFSGFIKLHLSGNENIIEQSADRLRPGTGYAIMARHAEDTDQQRENQENRWIGGHAK